MNIKVVTGGILEKNGKFLLVQENQNICKGKWNIPAGGLDENIKVNGNEISNVKWFTYDEILNMKGKLRAEGYFLSTIKNKIDNKIQSTEIIKAIKR